MATLTEKDKRIKYGSKLRMSSADMAKLTPEDRAAFLEKQRLLSEGSGLQAAFGAPQQAGGNPVDHQHGATLAQIAANNQAQLAQVNKTGMIGGIRQSPKNTGYNAPQGLDYLRTPDEVASRNDAWQKHTAARDQLNLGNAMDAVAQKKAEQSQRVNQSVFGPDGVAHTPGGGRVMMMPDGSFGYSTPAGGSQVNPSQVYEAPGGYMSVGEARRLGPVDRGSAGPLQAAQMDAENVRAQDRKATALDMLAGAKVSEVGGGGLANNPRPNFNDAVNTAKSGVGLVGDAIRGAGLLNTIGDGPASSKASSQSNQSLFDPVGSVAPGTGPVMDYQGGAPQGGVTPPSLFEEQSLNTISNIANLPQKGADALQAAQALNPRQNFVGDFFSGLINPLKVLAPQANTILETVLNQAPETLRSGVQQGLDYTGASEPLRGLKTNLGVAKSMGLVNNNSPALLDWLINLVMPEGSSYANLNSPNATQNADLMSRGLETNFAGPLSGLQTNIELANKVGMAPDFLTQLIPALMNQARGAVSNVKKGASAIDSAGRAIGLVE